MELINPAPVVHARKESSKVSLYGLSEAAKRLASLTYDGIFIKLQNYTRISYDEDEREPIDPEEIFEVSGCPLLL